MRILLEDYAAELGKLRPGLSVIVRVDTRQSTPKQDEMVAGDAVALLAAIALTL